MANSIGAVLMDTSGRPGHCKIVQKTILLVPPAFLLLKKRDKSQNPVRLRLTHRAVSSRFVQVAVSSNGVYYFVTFC